MRGTLEVALKAYRRPKQYCLQLVIYNLYIIYIQKAETIPSAVSYMLFIYNCRQYCFGLLGLISAVLMLR